ncbi:MAG TPA: thiamine phosphate synthase [Bryobacteraceae bacterium]|nr:thiamine phosphate synthase [Bryobacteraceae bacterium]
MRQELPPLYPILDTAMLEARGCPAGEAAAAMLKAGARILQFRHKGKFTREVFDTASRVSALCRTHGALFIVDDRADIAMMLDAGLHVGQDDVPVAIARRLIGPDRTLGFSTHNLDQLATCADAPVDYIAYGPVFQTASKQNPDPVVGIEGVRAAKAAAGARPLVAIGGITRANAAEVLAAGADSVAVISDLLPEPCTPESICSRLQEWLHLARK